MQVYKEGFRTVTKKDLRRQEYAMRRDWKKRAAAILVTGCLAAVPMGYMDHETMVFAEETTQENEWEAVLPKGYTLKQPVSITCSAVRVDSKNMCFTYGTGNEWNYTATDDTVLKVDKNKIGRNMGADGCTISGSDYKISFTVQGLKQGTTEITFYQSWIDSQYGDREQRGAFQTYRAEVAEDGTLTMQLLVSYEQGEFSFFANGFHKGIGNYSVEDYEIIGCEKSESGGMVKDISGKLYSQEEDGQQYVFKARKPGTTKVHFHYTNCSNTLVSKTYEVTVLEDMRMVVQETYGAYDHLADLAIPDHFLGHTRYYTIKDKEIAELEEIISVGSSLRPLPPGSSSVEHYLIKGKKKGTTTFVFHEYRNYTNEIDTITKYEIKVDENLDVTIGKVSTNQVGYVCEIDAKRKTAKTATINIPKVKAATGYQIVCATDKNFTKNKQSITTKKRKNIIKKLKKGKKYYVKVRVYRTVKGKKIYSMYSKVTEIAAR